MKKLIISALISALSLGAFCMTAEEAISTKDYSIINNYCISNNVNTWDFIFITNNIPFSDNMTIWNSWEEKYRSSWYLLRMINKYPGKYDEVENAYSSWNNKDYNSILNTPFQLFESMEKNSLSWFLQGKSEYSRLFVDHLIPDSVNFATEYENLTTMVLKMDSVSKGYGNYISTLKNRLKVADKYIQLLDIAIYEQRVDDIIDCLLKNTSNLTAEQINSIIEPINGVENDYRKADILKVLTNINSRYTIKLYDDQATWEPILAKIRAMISVRK